jgi:hypothetical protein
MGGKILLATLLKPQRCRFFLINCLVFGSHTDRNDAFTGLGFRDWKKLPINLLATNLLN